MTWFVFLLLIVLALLLLSNAPLCEARKKKSKKSLETSDDIHEKDVNKDGDAVEEIKYGSKEEMEKKIKDLQKQKQNVGSLDDEPLSEKEVEQLEKDEFELRKNVARAEIKYGEFSREKAEKLHQLGGNLFKQRRYNDILGIAEDIVRIHEKVDGVEHEKTGMALGNLGAVAYRVGESRKCELAMKRVMYILLKKHGPESKEVLLHRAKMLTFHVPNAEESEGLSHYDYLDELWSEETYSWYTLQMRRIHTLILVYKF